MQEEIKGRKVEIEAITGGYILTLIKGPLTPKTEREIYRDFGDLVGRIAQIYIEEGPFDGKPPANEDIISLPSYRHHKTQS